MDPSFSELYRSHYSAVLRFVRRRVRGADVDDVVSETFLAAWHRRDEMAVAPLPWLYRTARNVILNANRAVGRREGLLVRIASMSGDPGVGTRSPARRRCTPMLAGLAR